MKYEEVEGWTEEAIEIREIIKSYRPKITEMDILDISFIAWIAITFLVFFLVL